MSHRKIVYRNLPSNPERDFMDIIDKYHIDVEYTGNGKLSIGGFCPDFANMSKKVCIEIFGDYWHCRADVRKRDRIRIQTYAERGWKCIVIWASELNDEDIIVKRISPFGIL